MHILFMPSWYPDERVKNDISGIFFKELAEAFAARGHKVSVLANLLPIPYHPLKFLNFLKRESHYNQNGVNTFNIKFFHYKRFDYLNDSTFISASTRWFKSYIKGNGIPDIIHVHSVFFAGIYAYRISKGFNVPYLITEHSSMFLKDMEEQDRNLASEVIRNAVVFTAVSSDLMKTLVKSLNLDPQRGRVIGNLLNPIFIDTVRFKKEIDNFIFLNIGLDSPNKRRDLLLNAFTRAFKGNKKVSLWIGGMVAEGDSVIRNALSLGIENQVKLLGVMSPSDVKGALNECDVFVLSSDRETFGIVLIEALSQGLPVISTASGGPNDIVNSANGILVPPNDVNALSEAMKLIRLVYSRFDRNMIRRECLKKYHPDRIIREYLDAYEEGIIIR